MRDVPLDFEIRQLLQDVQIKPLLSSLYKNRKNTSHSQVQLPIANERFNIYAALQSSGLSAHDPTDINIDSFFEFNDMKLLKELNDLKVVGIIKVHYEDFSVSLVVKDADYIEKMRYWFMNNEEIVLYGLFALDRFTGEAYCGNYRYVFQPNMGLYRVMRAFLEEPSHTLSHTQISCLYQGTENESLAKEGSAVNQIIGDLRERLSMKGKMSGLFVPSDRKYLLRPS